MTSDIDTAADRVIELTNTVGAAAANLQNSRQTARTIRRLLSAAAKNPEYVATAGAALLALSAGLAVRNRQRPADTAAEATPRAAGSGPAPVPAPMAGPA